MTAPRWTTALLRRLAAPSEAEILVGDLEEAHRARVARRGPRIAAVLTALDAVDVALMLGRRRIRLPRPRLSWLDVKLAVRMLVRYPGLTLIGTGSLALGIAMASAVFAFIALMLWPRLPLPGGDRIVVVGLHDEAANQPESRVVADFLRWRGGTRTLTDFSAGRSMGRNLTMGDGIVEPVPVAEVTASMFSMARVGPLVGRTLTDDDAQAAAAPVMVIGERLWRERFGADPGLLGRQVLVSDVPTAVVGVMPAAFRFPSVYEVWQPLKVDPGAEPRAGIGITIFARLKPGISLGVANAELAVLSAQAAADWPTTHAHLKAGVLPAAVSDIRDPAERTALASLNLVAILLVLLVSGNVALLMFARAATRESEILVRTALGASRGRLVGQFVTEALVLGTLATMAGLWLGQRAMAWGVTTFVVAANDGKPLPFWITPDLPPISIAYGIGLALFATAVTGILPALKVTKGISSRLHEAAVGGGQRFSGVWTVLIVGQIALAVACPAFAFLVKRVALGIENQDIGVPPEQYLSARLMRESEMSQERFEAAVRRVREDLAAVPGVGRVTLADKLPLMWNGYYAIEVNEGGAAPPPEGQLGHAYRVSTAAVEPDFFAAFEGPPVAGRLLVPGDATPTPGVVVVNQSFVDKVLGGRNAVGRRIRYLQAGYDGQRPPVAVVPPWIEIVGVVRDIGMAVPPDPNTAGVYLPLQLRLVNEVHVAARVSGDMTSVTNALRSIAAKADPKLRMADVQSLAQSTANVLRTISYGVRALSIVSLSALVLALSGIYAVMSFAVSRRTREIGIRVALGSRRTRLVLTILRRPLLQVAAGVGFGGIATFLLARGFRVGLSYSPVLFVYALVMLGVCLLACIVPARRAMAVDPIAALRTD